MPNTTTILETVIAELAGAFVRDTRDDGTAFYSIRSDAPAWTREEDESGDTLAHRFHSAIDDRLPDDWAYASAASIAQTFTEYDADIETLRDSLAEIVDGDVEVYTNKLTGWLASHLGNVALCDEAMEEYGVEEEKGLEDRIRLGQYLALDRLANCLLEEIEREVERREEAAES